MPLGGAKVPHWASPMFWGDFWPGPAAEGPRPARGSQGQQDSVSPEPVGPGGGGSSGGGRGAGHALPGPGAGGRGPGAVALPAQPPQPRAGRGGRSGAAAARRAMSAPCLRLPAAGSAPAEADSAGGMEPPGAAALELALEEELALLAAAGEPPEPPPAAAARDPELLSLIRQKEKDLVLAARLGKALLERNQDMSRQYERMHKELTDKLEVRPRRAPPARPRPAGSPRATRPLPRRAPGAGAGPAGQPTGFAVAVMGKKGSEQCLRGLGEAKLPFSPAPSGREPACGAGAGLQHRAPEAPAGL